MDWQKKILIIFCPLLVMVYFFVQENKKAEVSHKASRSMASLPKVEKRQARQESKAPVRRKIAAVQERPKTSLLLRYRIPQSIEETFEKNSNIKLTKGYEFLNNVAAIPQESFDSSLGSVIQRTEGLVFFRANPGHQHIPVALSRSTNMLYPISSVLHVKSATPEVREDLLKQGYVQYYYHPPLKLLSLKTNPGNVVKVYSKLRKEGYKVELEVLKPHHQTF